MGIIKPTNTSVESFKGLHLYHTGFSNCSMRVRIALEEKKLDWTSHPVELVIVAVIGVSAILMGSGNASFLSFGELVPKIAEKFQIDPAKLLLPMQETSSLARTISPITAVIIAVAGLAEVPPFELVKRTLVPILGGILTVVVLDYLFYF